MWGAVGFGIFDHARQDGGDTNVPAFQQPTARQQARFITFGAQFDF
jgi:hypothetical protein